MTTKNKAITTLLNKVANDTYTQLDLEAIKLIANINLEDSLLEVVSIENPITESIDEEIGHKVTTNRKPSEFGRKAWSSEEDAIIKNAITIKQTVNEVYDMLSVKRTIDSIKSRVYKLGGSVYGITIVSRT